MEKIRNVPRHITKCTLKLKQGHISCQSDIIRPSRAERSHEKWWYIEQMFNYVIFGFIFTYTNVVLLMKWLHISNKDEVN